MTHRVDDERTAVAVLVRDVIGEILPGVPGPDITGDRHLRDLGADSIERVEIILVLMERLGIDPPMSTFADLPDIDALVDLLAGWGRG